VAKSFLVGATKSEFEKLREMGESYGLVFPKGSSNVVEFGKQFVKDYGVDTLLNVAKVHFSITREITGEFVPQVRGGLKAGLDVVNLMNKQKEILVWLKTMVRNIPSRHRL